MGCRFSRGRGLCMGCGDGTYHIYESPSSLCGNLPNYVHVILFSPIDSVFFAIVGAQCPLIPPPPSTPLPLPTPHAASPSPIAAYQHGSPLLLHVSPPSSLSRNLRPTTLLGGSSPMIATHQEEKAVPSDGSIMYDNIIN